MARRRARCRVRDRRSGGIGKARPGARRSDAVARSDDLAPPPRAGPSGGAALPCAVDPHRTSLSSRVIALWHRPQPSSI